PTPAEGVGVPVPTATGDGVGVTEPSVAVGPAVPGVGVEVGRADDCPQLGATVGVPVTTSNACTPPPGVGVATGAGVGQLPLTGACGAEVAAAVGTTVAVGAHGETIGLSVPLGVGVDVAVG